MSDLSILETMSAKEISSLKTKDLMELGTRISELFTSAKTMKEKFDDAIDLKFREPVILGLQAASKDTGTIRWFDGELQIMAEVPKKVTWDHKKMEEIVKRIPEEQRKNIVKTSYSIEERKYSMLPREYQELFREARTITPGKMRLQISTGDDQ